MPGPEPAGAGLKPEAIPIAVENPRAHNPHVWPTAQFGLRRISPRAWGHLERELIVPNADIPSDFLGQILYSLTGLADVVAARELLLALASLALFLATAPKGCWRCWPRLCFRPVWRPRRQRPAPMPITCCSFFWSPRCCSRCC